MPIISRWEPNGIYCRLEGTVTPAEINRTQRIVLNPPEGLVPRYQIVDALKADLLMGDQMQMFNISADDLAVFRKYPGFKFAFVNSKKEIEEFIANYLKISRSMDDRTDFRMFTSIESAREWIGLPYPKEFDDPSFRKSDSGNSLSLPNEG